MFTSIIKELLGTKIAEYIKYSQTLIDDKYESSNIASQKELRTISGINLNHTMYIAILIYQLLNNYTVDLIVTDTKI